MKPTLFLLFTLLFAGTIVLTSCNDPWEEVNYLQEKVMEVHDSSMVKMDVIYQTQKGLKKLIAVDSGDSLGVDQTVKETIHQALVELDEADAAMFAWMAQYEVPNPEKYTSETATQYLYEQLISIFAVDQKMDTAIVQGKQLLDQYGKE